jgi:hypothetical protein
MTTARAVPASFLAIGLALILLATLSVVQTQRMTVAPVETDLSTLFEPKTGQLTFQAPPYCGQFDIFCFIAQIFRLIFERMEQLFRAIFGGGSASAAAAANANSAATVSTARSTADADTCAAGRAGRDCRREQRRAESAQRRR